MSAPNLNSKRISIAVKFTAAIALCAAVATPSFAVGQHPEKPQTRAHTYQETASKELNTLAQFPLEGPAFRPPRRTRRRSGYRTTTGTRRGGCLGETDTAFSLLAPDENIGMSTSGRPTFVWHLPAAEETFPLRFRLLEPNADGIPEPIHTADLDYSAGFMTYELPPEVAALSPNKEYRWQVVIVCDPNYPSRSMVQELSVAVERPSAELEQSLSSATTAAERALAYGQEGFWYDAIAQVATATTPQERAVRRRLLEDLAAAEAENEELSETLLEIAQVVD